MRREWFHPNTMKAMLRKRGLLVLCVQLCVLCSYAQKISTIISKEKIVIGEQLTVKIQVEGITNSDVQQDFNFPDTVQHLEILSDSIDGDGPDFIHTLTITSFDSGFWQFPAFEIVLAGNRKLQSQAVDITVLPADISAMADYHDIKDILETDPENNWWIIALLVVAGLLSLLGFLWFTSNKTPVAKPVNSSSDLAKLYHGFLNTLKEMETGNITEKPSVITLFKTSSREIRSFADAAYQQNTAAFTTGEYMMALKGKLPDADTESKLFQFLRLADAVKFAKYIPPHEDIIPQFSILRKIAEEVYHQNKPGTDA